MAAFDSPAPADNVEAHSLPAPARDSTGSRSSSGSREQFGVSDKTRAKPHACIAAKLDFQAQRLAHRKSVVGGARVGRKASMHALAGGQHLSCLGDASSDAQEKMRGAAALYFLGGTSTLQQQRAAARARQHTRAATSETDQQPAFVREAGAPSPLEIMLPGSIERSRGVGAKPPAAPFLTRSPRPEHQKLEAELRDAIDNEDFLKARAP